MMVLRFLYLFTATLFLAPQFGYAQETTTELNTGEVSAEYERSIRLKGIQKDVVYYDPNGPAPSFDTTEKPVPEEERRRRADPQFSGEFNLPMVLITGGILFAILVLFFRFGGASSLVLRSDAQNAKRDSSGAARTNKPMPVDMQSFDGILSNPDRHQALISLAQLLIYKAVSANDLLLQRSWTARDVLRKMPKNSSYLPELSALVLKGELVHFGEREVSEEEFADFAARTKPLLRELST